MVSGIRAAMLLADAGYVTETACLLRIVSDLALEAVAVAEGEIEGKRTKAQQDFVAQFFSRGSASDADLLRQEKRRYVGREDLMKAHVSISKAVGLDGERRRDLMKAVVDMYDGYVHGAHPTAMELYHGWRHEFMLRGHESSEQRDLFRAAVAGKVIEVLHALGMVALAAGDQALRREISGALQSLLECGELEAPSR